MFLIYPFHKFEKNLNIDFFLNQKFLTQQILNHFNISCNFNINIESYDDYAKTYGKEAVAIGLLIYPLNQMNSHNLEELFFTGWKIMNKIWSFMNLPVVEDALENYLENSLNDPNFVFDINCLTFQKNNLPKTYLYISNIIKFVNLFSKGCTNANKIKLTTYTKPLLPFLHHNY